MLGNCGKMSTGSDDVGGSNVLAHAGTNIGTSSDVCAPPPTDELNDIAANAILPADFNMMELCRSCGKSSQQLYDLYTSINCDVVGDNANANANATAASTTSSGLNMEASGVTNRETKSCPSPSPALIKDAADNGINADDAANVANTAASVNPADDTDDMEVADAADAADAVTAPAVLLQPLSETQTQISSNIEDVLLEMQIWQLRIKPNDDLPQRICTKCMAKFNMIHTFRRKCLKVQIRLRALLEERQLNENPKLVPGTETANGHIPASMLCSELVNDDPAEPLSSETAAVNNTKLLKFDNLETQENERNDGNDPSTHLRHSRNQGPLITTHINYKSAKDKNATDIKKLSEHMDRMEPEREKQTVDEQTLNKLPETKAGMASRLSSQLDIDGAKSCAQKSPQETTVQQAIKATANATADNRILSETDRSKLRSVEIEPLSESDKNIDGVKVSKIADAAIAADDNRMLSCAATDFTANLNAGENLKKSADRLEISQSTMDSVLAGTNHATLTLLTQSDLMEKMQHDESTTMLSEETAASKNNENAFLDNSNPTETSILTKAALKSYAYTLSINNSVEYIRIPHEATNQSDRRIITKLKRSHSTPSTSSATSTATATADVNANASANVLASATATFDKPVGKSTGPNTAFRSLAGLDTTKSFQLEALNATANDMAAIEQKEEQVQQPQQTQNTQRTSHDLSLETKRARRMHLGPKRTTAKKARAIKNTDKRKRSSSWVCGSTGSDAIKSELQNCYVKLLRLQVGRIIDMTPSEVEPINPAGAMDNVAISTAQNYDNLQTNEKSDELPGAATIQQQKQTSPICLSEEENKHNNEKSFRYVESAGKLSWRTKAEMKSNTLSPATMQQTTQEISTGANDILRGRVENATDTPAKGAQATDGKSRSSCVVKERIASVNETTSGQSSDSTTTSEGSPSASHRVKLILERKRGKRYKCKSDESTILVRTKPRIRSKKPQAHNVMQKTSTEAAQTNESQLGLLHPNLSANGASVPGAVSSKQPCTAEKLIVSVPLNMLTDDFKQLYATPQMQYGSSDAKQATIQNDHLSSKEGPYNTAATNYTVTAVNAMKQPATAVSTTNNDSETNVLAINAVNLTLLEGNLPHSNPCESEQSEFFGFNTESDGSVQLSSNVDGAVMETPPANWTEDENAEDVLEAVNTTASSKINEFINNFQTHCLDASDINLDTGQEAELEQTRIAQLLDETHLNEMNDVESTLNGILNEMQDQHIYTPVSSHSDDFFSPSVYSPLSEPPATPAQNIYAESPAGTVGSTGYMSIASSPCTPGQLQQHQPQPQAIAAPLADEQVGGLNANANIFINNYEQSYSGGSHYTEDSTQSELIGFQNNIPCFENIEMVASSVSRGPSSCNTPTRPPLAHVPSSNTALQQGGGLLPSSIADANCPTQAQVGVIENNGVIGSKEGDTESAFAHSTLHSAQPDKSVPRVDNATLQLTQLWHELQVPAEMGQPTLPPPLQPLPQTHVQNVLSDGSNTLPLSSSIIADNQMLHKFVDCNPSNRLHLQPKIPEAVDSAPKVQFISLANSAETSLYANVPELQWSSAATTANITTSSLPSLQNNTTYFINAADLYQSNLISSSAAATQATLSTVAAAGGPFSAPQTHTAVLDKGALDDNENYIETMQQQPAAGQIMIVEFITDASNTAGGSGTNLAQLFTTGGNLNVVGGCGSGAAISNYVQAPQQTLLIQTPLQTASSGNNNNIGNSNTHLILTPVPPTPSRPQCNTVTVVRTPQKHPQQLQQDGQSQLMQLQLQQRHQQQLQLQQQQQQQQQLQIHQQHEMEQQSQHNQHSISVEKHAHLSITEQTQQQKQEQQHQQQPQKRQRREKLKQTPEKINLSCRFCHKRQKFINNLDYSNHIIAMHPAENPFNCPYCPMHFTRRFKQQQHILDQHGSLRFQCAQCGEIFNAQRSLDLHLQRYHAPDIPEHHQRLVRLQNHISSPSSTSNSRNSSQTMVHVEDVHLHMSEEGKDKRAIEIQLDSNQIATEASASSSAALQRPQSRATHCQDFDEAIVEPNPIAHANAYSHTCATQPAHVTLPSPEQTEPDSTSTTTLRHFRKRRLSCIKLLSSSSTTSTTSPSTSTVSSLSSLSSLPSTTSASSSTSSTSLSSSSTSTSSSSSSIANHLREDGALRSSLNCVFCNEQFTNDIALRKHHQLAHNFQTSMPFLCSICKRGYRMRNALQRHMETHDSEGRPYECTICHVRFPRPSQLTLHKLSVHFLKKPHTCQQCSKQFGTESALKTHIKFHGEKGIECDICGRKFFLKKDMRKHRRIHTGELFYKCDFCPSSFLHYTRLSAHMKSHISMGLHLEENAPVLIDNQKDEAAASTSTHLQQEMMQQTDGTPMSANSP